MPEADALGSDERRVGNGVPLLLGHLDACVMAVVFSASIVGILATVLDPPAGASVPGLSVLVVLCAVAVVLCLRSVRAGVYVSRDGLTLRRTWRPIIRVDWPSVLRFGIGTGLGEQETLSIAFVDGRTVQEWTMRRPPDRGGRRHRFVDARQMAMWDSLDPAIEDLNALRRTFAPDVVAAHPRAHDQRGTIPLG